MLLYSIYKFKLINGIFDTIYNEMNECDHLIKYSRIFKKIRQSTCFNSINRRTKKILILTFRFIENPIINSKIE